MDGGSRIFVPHVREQTTTKRYRGSGQEWTLEGTTHGALQFQIWILFFKLSIAWKIMQEIFDQQ